MSIMNHRIIVRCIRHLTKIELPSILFFLGILLAVAALESLGILFTYAEQLNHGDSTNGYRGDVIGHWFC